MKNISGWGGGGGGGKVMICGMFGHKDQKDYILCAIRICSSFSATDITGGISSRSSL